ncbi:ketopantoate reductase PanE/ApbA-domain-containing protein [Microdochium trichocladiopsis]|uniref:Ketopantoate reductase PanE/ApbA-domain-containing protein n=1 Tax=Microdochium trichocladiopsis TaxID=1682393 RepID=A0A9P8YEY9_9PEZI|nr:ketopantoate reductase PanE/ApbA-domain-containing protein [Microdochium trichocladiopsis]KAH7038088.1 ketopantoate reductase PanE/ApbA-domain-containing protein [Microdochium trichocladiopsis]
MDQKVLIFGTGSIGTVYAWVVSNTTSPDNVVCVCRSNYEAAKTSGFTLNSTIWGQNLKFRPTIVQSVAEAATYSPENTNDDVQERQGRRAFDFIILTSKVHTGGVSPSTAEILRPVVTLGHTVIVLIQNGIGIEDEYAELYPDNPLLSCVVRVPATQTSPGVVEHKAFEGLSVGTYPSFPPDSAPSEAGNDNEALAADGGRWNRGGTATIFAQRSSAAANKFISMITAGGATATLYPDIQAQRWQKLVLNVAWNPVTALSRLRDQHFLRTSSVAGHHSSTTPGWPLSPSTLSPRELEQLDPEFSSLGFVRDLMLEVARTAAAYGYGEVCDSQLVEKTLDLFLAMPLEGIQSSMMADALQGKSMEIEAIVGNAARLARAKGVSTPILKTIYILIRGLDASFRL